MEKQCLLIASILGKLLKEVLSDLKNKELGNTHKGLPFDKNLKQKSDCFLDFWGPLLLTLSLYFGIRTFVAEARYIPSGSMLPGLQIQDRLLIEKMTYLWKAPSRGDVVVFNSPYSFDPVLSALEIPRGLRCFLLNLPLVASIPGLGSPACDAYIKRVVAIAGDKIHVNNIGEVTLNGVKIQEPYASNFCLLPLKSVENCRGLRITVPSGNVLVLGDNRSNSWDSRFWPGGPFLPEKEILGRAVWRFWPMNRIGFI